MSFTAIASVGARFAAANAGPIARQVGIFAATSLALSAVAEGGARLSEARTKAKAVDAAEQAKPTVAPGSPVRRAHLRYRAARLAWKSSDKATRRAIVRRRAALIGHTVLKAPKVTWKAIVRTVGWSARVLTNDFYFLSTVVMGAAWSVLTTANHLLAFLTTAVLGSVCASVVYVFTRPFSEREDSLRYTRRAFLLFEPIFGAIQYPIDALRRATRTVATRWYGKDEVIEVAPLTSEPVQEPVLSTADIVVANIRSIDLLGAPMGYGKDLFRSVSNQPVEVWEELDAKLKGALDRMVASKNSGVTARHRTSVMQGYRDARRTAETPDMPQAS